MLSGIFPGSGYRGQKSWKRFGLKWAFLDTLVLVLLSRGDLVEYMELGGWFRRMKDPILLEFLRVWGRVEVEGGRARQVQQDLIEKHQLIEKRI